MDTERQAAGLGNRQFFLLEGIKKKEPRTEKPAGDGEKVQKGVVKQRIVRVIQDGGEEGKSSYSEAKRAAMESADLMEG